MSPYFTCSQIYVYSPAYKHSFPLSIVQGHGQSSILPAHIVVEPRLRRKSKWQCVKNGTIWQLNISYCKLRITKENEENRAEKEKKEEIGGQFCRRRKYLIWDVEGKRFIFWGRRRRRKKRRKLWWGRKMDGQKNEKGEIVLHSTQPLARWGIAAQICSEIRNLNKKSQVGCRGWWLKMDRWRGGGALWGGWKWHLSHLGAHCDSSNIKFPRGELEISMWILSIRLDFAYFGNSCYFVSIFALNLIWNHEQWACRIRKHPWNVDNIQRWQFLRGL